MVSRQPLRIPLGAGGVVGVVCAQVAIGLVAVRNPELAILLSVVLAGGLVAMFSPLAIAALAFPATIASWRLGGGSLNMSYADAVLVLAVLFALPFVPWHSRLLHRILATAGVYLVILAVTLLANPSTRAVLELFHRLVIVCGAIAVGSALAAAGKTRFALRWLIGACVALAVVAIVDTLSHALEPAYPLGVHKNAAGFLLTAALLVLVIAPDLVAVPRAALLPAQALLAAGLLACQSRASAATFLAALFIASLRRRGSRAFVPLIGSIALVAMIWVTSQNLTEDSPEAKFNSLNTRVETYDSALDIWSAQPVLGAGLRYWNDPAHEGSGEPHNVILASLGESGLVGTVGLLVLLTMVIAALRRRQDQAGRLAIYLLVAHVVNGLADIYWVAGRGTLPWLVVGLAVGIERAPDAHSGAGSRRAETAPLADHAHAALDLR